MNVIHVNFCIIYTFLEQQSFGWSADAKKEKQNSNNWMESMKKLKQFSTIAKNILYCIPFEEKTK